MELFDTHAHYNDEKFELDKEDILSQVYKQGITKLVCAGYNLEASKEAVKIAQVHDFVYATVGISPNDIPEKGEEFETNLESQLLEINQLAKHEKVIAIGEIGLDYYWNKENKEEQKLAFTKQIQLANELELPIVIHTREAIYDTLEILKNKVMSTRKGIFHCCPLNLDLIKEGLKLGFYISFAGTVTFKNAKNAEEAIKAVPLDRILIETDSPYLAPEPKRGTRNDSRNVYYIAEKIAKVKEKPINDIAAITYENAKRIFMLT